MDRSNAATPLKTPNFYMPSEDMVELLQSILETSAGRVVSFEEAQEIGIQLVSLYECLARERKSPEGDGRRERQ